MNQLPGYSIDPRESPAMKRERAAYRHHRETPECETNSEKESHDRHASRRLVEDRSKLALEQALCFGHSFSRAVAHLRKMKACGFRVWTQTRGADHIDLIRRTVLFKIGPQRSRRIPRLQPQGLEYFHCFAAGPKRTVRCASERDRLSNRWFSASSSSASSGE